MASSRRALIVATNDYEDPGLKRLTSPARDAEALAEVLGDPSLGDFEVEIVQNQTSYVISERVESLFAEGKTGDLLLLHFSCHGLKDDYGELYLAATNTRPDRLAATGVDANLVNRLMRRSRAQRVILLLDCCYGGAFERGMTARAGGSVDVGDQFARAEQELGGGRGRVVIAASTSMEFAFEGSQLADDNVEPSVFTGALVEGLTTGLADRDHDGLVSLGELYDFVFEQVRERSPKQTPGKWEFGVQGELIVARNPQRVVVPTELPTELLDVLDHQVAKIRLGAVGLLEELAAGPKLAVAAAGRQRLEQIAGHDDSKSVVLEAEAALARTQVRLSRTDVDFGTLAPGTTSEAEVTIEGVPLAQASVVSTPTPELRVKRAESAFRIEFSAVEPGPFEGLVAVTGPAGSAQVRVTATVAAVAAALAPAATAPVAPAPAAPTPAVPAAPPPKLPEGPDLADVPPSVTQPVAAPDAAAAVGPDLARMRPAALSLGGWGLLLIASLVTLAASSLHGDTTVEDLDKVVLGFSLTWLKPSLLLVSLAGLAATSVGFLRGADRLLLGVGLGLAAGAVGVSLVIVLEVLQPDYLTDSFQGMLLLVPGLIGAVAGSVLVLREDSGASVRPRPSGPVLGLLAAGCALAAFNTLPNLAESGYPIGVAFEGSLVVGVVASLIVATRTSIGHRALAGLLAGTAAGYVLPFAALLLVFPDLDVGLDPLRYLAASALVAAGGFLVLRDTKPPSEQTA